jgi:serine/threonine-protein kinase
MRFGVQLSCHTVRASALAGSASTRLAGHEVRKRRAAMFASNPPNAPTVTMKMTTRVRLADDLDESGPDAAATAPTLPSRGSPSDPTPTGEEPRSETRAIEPAARIGDVYRVLGTLGTGAMGTVLLAQDESLDRRVAIKFIRHDLIDSDFRLRFIEEARAMARVNHPNVLQIYAFGEHRCVPYFVMEFVDGMTLEQWRGRRAMPIDVDLLMRIIDETCHGLSAIHAADTLHRDLKPSNILLDAKLRPRIADMGLAVLRRDHGSMHCEIAGTPAYMAPEVAFGREVDHAHRSRADVYSLACVAYELLTGQPPFQAETQVALMLRHATAPVPPPSQFNAALAPEVDRAILRAHAKDPAGRTPTAEALRSELMLGHSDPEPERILVVDDDVDSRDALRSYLELRFPDAEVEGECDGFGAIAAFDRRPPSVVILDLCMPGLDGLQVTEQIRRREESRRVPIIIVTASGGPEQWGKLSDLGADGFLVKPISFDDVVALIRRSLRERLASVCMADVGTQ